MKAKIMKDGFIKIKTENISEAFAIEHLMDAKKSSELFIIDNSILKDKEKKDKPDTVTER